MGVAAKQDMKNLDDTSKGEAGQAGWVSRLFNSRVLRFSIIIIAGFAAAAYWKWGADGQWDIGKVAGELAELSNEPWGMAAVVAVFVVAGLFLFPVTILFVAVAIVYPPVKSMLVSGAGAICSALVLYFAGRVMGMQVGKKAKKPGQLEKIIDLVEKRGVGTIAMIRLLPIAPYSLVNMVAGAAHIRLWVYLLGTIIGMAPGIVAITLTIHFASRAMLEPNLTNVTLAAAVLVAAVLVAIWGIAYLKKKVRD